MNNLKRGHINLNDKEIIQKVKKEIQKILIDKKSYFSLSVNEKSFYFKTSKALPGERGWYIILHRKRPIYVGWANSLNSRLSTRNGSLDNFRNSLRKYDSQRNFIKKFIGLKIFTNLKICTIREYELCKRLELKGSNLKTVDRSKY